MYIACGETLVDTVPLHEILAVSEMNDDTALTSRLPSSASAKFTLNGPSSEFSRACSSAARTGSSERTTKANLEHDANMSRGMLRASGIGNKFSTVHIKTTLDGFNFGKTYYLRPASKCSVQLLVSELASAVKFAKERLHRKSIVAKSQDCVKRVHGSFAFQMLMALLIMTVRNSRDPVSDF